MRVQKVSFSIPDTCAIEDISDFANTFLGSLRMNGQVCGREWATYQERDQWIAIVLTPEANSLNAQHDSKYCQGHRLQALERGMTINSQILSEEQESLPCTCAAPSAYVLFTTYVSMESPIRCLDCFSPTPLYRFPKLPSGDYHEIIRWQSDYEAADRLQMNCKVLEKAATRELSHLHSRLSKNGRELCGELSALTGKSFYYYLYRAHGRSAASEAKRRCPSCGKPWRLKSELHSLFGFRCDDCLLLSNVAWDIQTQ